ncbi:bifunctional diguanylate cyclase/phosphodiesterase [Henriciella litoralis]|uniref:bifunctional diguanylate cyclase/phosphodiesterase n=1 Tax=Henriciella litoralis TaxID=568102 RepID=UPI000A003D52|nr:EAL domain-containing protein [Henriciella litoralis]
MYRVISCVQDEHAAIYVMLAMVVCALGTTCSLVVFDRSHASRTVTGMRVWAAVSGVAAGLSVWGTHFVAMLGYEPGFSVAFDGWTTANSALLAIAGFVLASQLMVGRPSLVRRLLVGTLATMTLAAMHFYGQGALKSSALIEYDAGYVLAAIGVCWAFFLLAYANFRASAGHWRRGITLVATLLGVAGIHFVGTAAMTVFPLSGLADISWVLEPSDLGHWIIAGVVIILLAAFAAASFDAFVSRIRTQGNRRIAMLADSASEGIIIANAKGECVEVNKVAAELLGRTRDALLRTPVSCVAGLSAEDVAGMRRLETTIRSANGEEIPVELRGRKLAGEDGNFTVLTITDLRERLRYEAEIRVLAFQDQLSGLANREAFQRELALVTETGPVRHSALILIDLDEFKDVNDQFGHAAGDAVIIETSRRLEAITPEGSVIARLGGDEFAILTGPGLKQADVEKIGKTCVAELCQPVRHEGIFIRTGASAGIFLIEERGLDGGQMLKSADRALYAAKSEGRGRSRIYDAQLHEIYEARRDIETALSQAVERNEFVLHYQPKVSSRTRAILGYEALIRWKRPGHGLLMPADFIDIAEQSMLINDIGRWCMMEACRAAASWPNDYSVSINLSARQFLDPKLYGDIRNALRVSKLAPERLELEITETALIQNIEAAANLLEKLKKLGVMIAFDDFGTGYSSMRFIQQLPFDRIKIDRSFISSMGTDSKSLAVVDAILKLGQSLSIPVVAEGVETEEQALQLLQANCGELQGYLISRPKPIEEPDESGLDQDERGIA